MDDQFGGRTDDDLFADDFEPISDDNQLIEEDAPIAATEESASTLTVFTVPTVPTVPSVPTAPTASPAPQEPAPQTNQQPTAQDKGLTSAPYPAATKGLANSKYSDKRPSSRPRRQSPATRSSSKNATPPPTTAPAAPASPSADTGTSSRDSKPIAAPAAPAAGPAIPGQNTALRSEERIKSGANPRTKLTEEELAARLEKMRILNAETTRKFERAEADQRTHAEAYAKGMEEARKRRKAEEERRRRGEEERRRMDEERAKNRERKLRAMQNKEGGWDQGKEEQEDVRDFHGAHGGVRGARGLNSLADSRYARDDGDGYSASNRFVGEEGFRGGRGRGRGRGGPGRGRGGRGSGGGGGSNRDRDGLHDDAPSNASAELPTKPVINTEDFPALPGTEDKPSPLSPLASTNWGEEMEALDEKVGKKP
ncbi:hypothetical protein SODALDRAFT_328015 [Sodiomyces alkalinus F11]|uniref:Uncharacterized protein n=1 Tax=Sodiomyces alkalinus (strain CBS 110278 / VKM F-3762 / F11) TaxID=1314773 RepID=A0A3N2QAM8_SODAK|nr:hypothetical protein SODALDRAFT_328015 [Sodiomyces alkalinus F11]ROT43804.1 hypothetical protein SODALDRAFT_328015 [Sodiomyces alkalinus F11]